MSLIPRRLGCFEPKVPHPESDQMQGGVPRSNRTVFTPHGVGGWWFVYKGTHCTHGGEGRLRMEGEYFLSDVQ